MEHPSLIMTFFLASEQDCRIGKGHLALFTALYLYWCKLGYPSPLKVFGQQVMPMAKISATSTYYRLLNELCQYGYLRYAPSFYKGKASELYFDCVIENVKDEEGAVRGNA